MAVRTPPPVQYFNSYGTPSALHSSIFVAAMAFAMQSTLMGAKMAAPARSQAKPARSAVVCTASAEDARRAVRVRLPPAACCLPWERLELRRRADALILTPSRSPVPPGGQLRRRRLRGSEHGGRLLRGGRQRPRRAADAGGRHQAERRCVPDGPPRWERGQAAWHTVTGMAAAPHAACALDPRSQAPVTSRIAAGLTLSDHCRRAAHLRGASSISACAQTQPGWPAQRMHARSVALGEAREITGSGAKIGTAAALRLPPARSLRSCSCPLRVPALTRGLPAGARPGHRREAAQRPGDALRLPEADCGRDQDPRGRVPHPRARLCG